MFWEAVLAVSGTLLVAIISWCVWMFIQYERFFNSVEGRKLLELQMINQRKQEALRQISLQASQARRSMMDSAHESLRDRK